MSRRLVIGLLALILSLGVTIWSLVLIREEPAPLPSAAQRPAAPDQVSDPSAEEKRSAAVVTNGATAQPPAATTTADPPSPPPAVAPSQSAAPVVTETPTQAVQAVVPAPVAVPVVTPTAPPVIPTPVPAPAVAAAVPAAAAPAQAAPPVAATPPAARPSEQQVAAAAEQPVISAVPSVATPAAEPAATPAVAAPTRASVPPPVVTAAITPPPPPPAPRRTAPSFDVVRVTADGSAVIAGRAEPGATVTVLDGTREIGRVTADARGEWVLLPTTALTAGTRELSLLARGPGDIPELRSERVVVLAVPERHQAAISGGALAVSVVRGASTTEPSRPLQIPSAKPAAGLPLALESVDYDAAGNSVLGGRAPAGAVLRIYVDGRAIGQVVADSDGRWQLTPEGSIAPGVYTLRVDQLGADGRVAQRIELPFSRAEPATELASVGDKIIVQPGNSLWRIARRVYGVGMQYSVIYQANRAMIRDPDMIYPGQIFSLPSRN